MVRWRMGQEWNERWRLRIGSQNQREDFKTGRKVRRVWGKATEGEKGAERRQINGSRSYVIEFK